MIRIVKITISASIFYMYEPENPKLTSKREGTIETTSFGPEKEARQRASVGNVQGLSQEENKDWI